MPLWDFLGVVVGGYTAYAVFDGAVYARYRAWGRTIRREEDPFNFWSVIVCYTLLALALLFVF